MAIKKRQPKKRQPLWDWSLGITQTGLGQFLACREQFALGYIEGWTSKGFSVPLEFGSVIHLAIQQWADIVEGNISKSPDDLIREICAQYHDARAKTLNKLDIATMSKTLAAAEAVFPLYAQEVLEDDRKQKWIAHEQLFNVPYEFALGEVGTASINLRGVRDGAYRTKRCDYLGLFETKTRSQIDDNAVQASLRADLQTMFYLHTMRLEYGETPKEVLYNVIRRPGQKFLDRDTYATFKQRIIDDIKKRPSYYVRRYEISVLESDLNTFRDKVLNPTLNLMAQWWGSVKENPFDRFKSPYHYLNLNALYTKYGTCQLYNLMVLGRQKDYYVRSLLFPEFENASCNQKKAS
jgi:hypothetical protein